MGTILTVASGKGGCAKTTTCILLAANLAAAGYRVAAIDADRSRSLMFWHETTYEGPAFPCVSETDHIKVVDVASQLAETHDVVIVDTAGFENLTAASAMGMADFVLVPCIPDRATVLESIKAAHQLASISKASRRDIPYSVLPSRWKAKGLTERAALDMLHDAQLVVMETTISSLSDMPKASFSGVVPTGGKLGEQASRLIAELIGKGAIPTMPSSSPALASPEAAA